MRTFTCFVIITLFMISCNSSTQTEEKTITTLPIKGTWKLISGTTIEKNDTVVTDYIKDKSFIKVINDTHFAFMGHDLSKGKDSSAFFSSGGGRYELTDSNYTEHLEYCGDRQWEGTDFNFTITVSNDTLVQQGIEKVESANVNRINIEKYVRMKN